MCRGGKDGIKKRCRPNQQQKSSASLRKQIKYRADKDGVTVDQWKQDHEQEVTMLTQEAFPPSKEVSFQPIEETRRLAPGIPEEISDHIAQSKAVLEAELDADERKALTGYTGLAAAVCNPVLVNDYKLQTGTIEPGSTPWRETVSAPHSFPSKENLQDYLNTMDKVLEKRNDASAVLYRGHPIYSGIHEKLEQEIGREFDATDTESMKEALASYYKPGKVFEYPSYLSTTSSAMVAAERTENILDTKIEYYDTPEAMGVMLEMKTNAGRDATGISRSQYEREVVLPRDMRFRVDSIDLTPASYNTVSGFDHLNDPGVRDEEDFKKVAIVVKMVEVDENGHDINHTQPHRPAPLELKD